MVTTVLDDDYGPVNLTIILTVTGVEVPAPKLSNKKKGTFLSEPGCSHLKKMEITMPACLLKLRKSNGRQ